MLDLRLIVLDLDCGYRKYMMYSMLPLDSVISLYWWGSYHYGTQYSNVQAYKYAELSSYTHTFRVVALDMLFTYKQPKV